MSIRLQILERARERFLDAMKGNPYTGCRYVCVAISESSRDSGMPYYSPIAHDLRAEVMAYLDGESTVEGHLKLKAQSDGKVNQFPAVRAFRLFILDSMIAKERKK